jgi:hypothetical protein
MPEPNLSPEEMKKFMEEKEKAEYTRIKKEIEQKIFIEKHRKQIIKYSILSGVGVVALIILIPLIVFFISELTKKPEVTPPVEVEKPPADFKVEVMETKLLKSNGNQYDILAKIRNINPDWGVSKLDYKFILKDKLGAKVGERERESYILPQQERYLIEIGVESLTEAETVELELTLSEAQKLKQFVNPQAQLAVKDMGHFVSEGKSRANGLLSNQSSFGFEKVDINVILYNPKDEVVGVNYTNLNAFLPGTERYFSVAWSGTIKGASRVEIEPNVNVFETGSFMDIYGTGQTLEY